MNEAQNKNVLLLSPTRYKHPHYKIKPIKRPTNHEPSTRRAGDPNTQKGVLYKFK